MNSEQLQKTRQEQWRQNGNALLTLDDAERWLNENQLCLFLPRRAHLPVPAPSFAEAVGGKADATPGPETLAQAKNMMARLVASGAAVPLNLFGTPGEHPDFLATPEALMFLYALQGERNPKHGPQSAGSGRVSPLAVDVWKVLEREGALTADELRERVGRETTEAAVLRALAELWHGLRVAPAPGENDEPAHWEPLSARHRKAITSGSAQSQTTALSMLVSYYLRSAIIGSGEEIELFLSPVTSRSRVRDVLRGLSANRQLGTLPMGTQMHFYVEGTLPEFAEEEMAAIEADAGLEGNEPDINEAAARTDAGERGAGAGKRAGERTHTPRPARGARPERPAFGERKTSRPSFGQRAQRPSFGERGRRPFGAGGFGAREGAAERPSRTPFRRADEGRPAPRGERKGEGRGTPRGGGFGAQRGEGTGARPPKRFGGASASFKPGGFRKPFSKPGGEGGARPPFRRAGDAGGDRSQWPGAAARPGAARPGAARPGAARPGAKFGAARPGSSRFGAGSRGPRPGAGSSGERTERPRSFDRREGGGPSRGPGRPPQRRQAGGSSGSFGARVERPARTERSEGSERPARRPFGEANRAGGNKPRVSRTGGDRPSFSRGEGRPPARAEGGARTFRPARPFKPGNSEGARPPRREGGDRPPARTFGGRAGSFKPRVSRTGGDRPSFPRREGSAREGSPAGGPSGSRPFKPRSAEGARPPRREGGFAKGAGSAPGDSRPRTGGGRPSGGVAKKGFSGPKGSGFKPADRKSGAAKPGGFKPGGRGGFAPPKRKGSRRPDEGGAA